FIADCEELCLKSQPKPKEEFQQLGQRTWVAGPAQVVLSWPGYFSPENAMHRAIAALDYGSQLTLRARKDGKTGWELADMNGVTVARMSQAFTPPKGKIIEVRVAAILTRQKRFGDQALNCEQWEVILPEILYLNPNAADQK
ncbi:MAG TPA: hypothetical protein VLS45_03035, partial [Methylomicrobium sp.]|nr:hypothetical protein [Methylomicrobium sp.]